ncbi:hypothetical protein GCM10022237_04160 [Nocardioides ginsengisoli]|uniref:LysM peptidoglycan-binding domain-containing protein n=1 Tax=Nocardioides ginsengisoli TaxID=363868 RepID=A0ABW3VXD6_9ACTN
MNILRFRAAGVWSAVTAGTLAVAMAGVPEVMLLAQAPGPGFAELLTQCCTAAALVASVALWLTATEVAWRVLRSGREAGREAGREPGRGRARTIGPVRRLLLAACGVGVLAAATPAHAGPPHPPAPPPTSLAGLPLPDRPVDGPSPATTIRVRPGDTLWAIATRALGPGASGADVTTYWRRIHARNAAVIGADPDLIHPGQTLRLPEP